jgi:hypothetical protein
MNRTTQFRFVPSERSTHAYDLEQLRPGWLLGGWYPVACVTKSEMGPMIAHLSADPVYFQVSHEV